jgi:glutamyl-tRNA synthetase
MTVITRFAPSPTGYLHIGGARTALFNWLFARHHHGKFLLRIEDTDRARSTEAAIDAIHEGMRWLGLDSDGEVLYQFSRADRHAEVARELVAKGQAYYCYTSPEELTALRDQATAEKRNFRFDSPWRDATATPPTASTPRGIQPVIRLKSPRDGVVIIPDKVQGDVTIGCDQLEDVVLLRSDGTPTYMLAVVVDDHDMGITHIIRGDDHLTNAAKQMLIYQAMGWDIPVFAHVPMIHGADGAKLSKRHGALGVEAYRGMGYLPETMRNYLLRLGWSHGDDEIISTEQAMEWFNLEAIGQSPARLDFSKLENLNGYYIRQAADDRLVSLILPLLEKQLAVKLPAPAISRLIHAMKGLKERAKTINELAANALFYVHPLPLPMQENAKPVLQDAANQAILQAMMARLEALTEWNHDALSALAKDYATETGVKLGTVMQPLRVALTGSTTSPSVFEILEVLGKAESRERLQKGVSKQVL